MTSIRKGAREGCGLFDSLIVDNFAGAGGASMGIEAAMGRSVDIAVNHDRHSVEMHQLNHPNTKHLCEDVWHVDPIEATAGRPVGLAWFSPDCRHFSRAKGGKPVQKKIRGLAWVVIRWAKLVRPRIIILENVREFQEWGPLTSEDKPCPDRKGQTFKKWLSTLRNLGYAVDTRILNAADFGAPTHRRRFFLVARCDGLPITWPEPTHGPGRRPYRTAAQCIDWTLPCPSIFLSKSEAKSLRIIRPLAEKTMRRIAMGLKRYVIDNPKPFIVTCNHSGPEFRGQGVNEPFKTLTASRDAHGLVAPFIARCAHGDESASGAKRWGKGSHEASEPLPTLTGSKDFAVTLPFLSQNYGEAAHQQSRSRSVDRPINTITPANNSGVLVAAHLTKFRENSIGASADEPMPTITSGAGSCRPAGAAHAMGIVAANLTKYHGQKGNESCAKSPNDPLPTVDTLNRFGLVSAFLAKHYGGVVGHGVERPLGTITAVDHHSVVAAFMDQQYGQSAGSGADAPVGTMTAANHHAIVASNLVHMNHGEKQWSSLEEPMRTITAAGFHAAEVRAFLMRYYSSGGQAGVVDAPAPTITSKDRLGVVTVRGQAYQIIDIGLRMLAPRELLQAQFGKYAANYILTGTKSQQVARIGNSVPPELAEAIVRANVGAEAEVAA